MNLSSSFARYWRAARAPRYSLTFAFPLLVAYEALAFTLSHDSLAGVRNGADVLLKSVFVMLGGRNGLLAFGALLVGTGIVLVWRDRRRSGPIELRVFLGMAVESVLYALVFGLGAGTPTGPLPPGAGTPAAPPARARPAQGRIGPSTPLLIPLGPG